MRAVRLAWVFGPCVFAASLPAAAADATGPRPGDNQQTSSENVEPPLEDWQLPYDERASLAPQRPRFGGGRALDRVENGKLVFRNVVPYPSFFPTSFTATFVGLRVSGEHQSSDVHPVNGWSTMSQIAATESLEGGFNLFKLPLAFVYDLNATGVSGINDSSIVARGTMFSFGYHAGAILDVSSIITSIAGSNHSRWQLALNVEGGQSWGDTIVVQNALGAINANPRSQNFVDTVGQLAKGAVAEIVTPFDDWNISGYVTWAYAFSAHFAIQQAAGIDYLSRSLSPHTQVDQITSMSWTALPRIGTAVSVDPATRYFPVALLLEYVIAPTTEHDNLNPSTTYGVSTWALGLYYSHPEHPDLHLELLGFVRTGSAGDAGHVVGAPLVEPQSQTLGGQAVGRYIW